MNMGLVEVLTDRVVLPTRGRSSSLHWVPALQELSRWPAAVVVGKEVLEGGSAPAGEQAAAPHPGFFAAKVCAGSSCGEIWLLNIPSAACIGASTPGWHQHDACSPCTW
jgi:hypothetical protein